MLLSSIIYWFKAKFWSVVNWFKSKFTKIASPPITPQNEPIDTFTLSMIIDDSNQEITEASKIAIQTLKQTLKQDPHIDSGLPHRDTFTSDMLKRHFDFLEQEAKATNEKENFIQNNVRMFLNIFNRPNMDDKLYRKNAELINEYTKQHFPAIKP